MSTQFVIRAYDTEWEMYMYYTAGLTLHAWSSNPSYAQIYPMRESAVGRRDTMIRILLKEGKYNNKYRNLEVVPVEVTASLIRKVTR